MDHRKLSNYMNFTEMLLFLGYKENSSLLLKYELLKIEGISIKKASIE